MAETKSSLAEVSAGKLTAIAYAVHCPADQLAPWSFEQRQPGPHDALIEIRYCGVCHTDIHFVRIDWGNLPVSNGART